MVVTAMSLLLENQTCVLLSEMTLYRVILDMMELALNVMIKRYLNSWVILTTNPKSK